LLFTSIRKFLGPHRLVPVPSKNNNKEEEKLKLKAAVAVAFMHIRRGVLAAALNFSTKEEGDCRKRKSRHRRAPNLNQGLNVGVAIKLQLSV
jgi:hypothetical protein